MIGGSFYPETIGLANLAALNPRRATGMSNRDKAGLVSPEIAFCGCIFPDLNSAYLKLFWVI